MSLEELYCKGARVWLPDPLDVWQGAVLASGYKRGVKELQAILDSGELKNLRVRDPDKDLPPLRNPEILTGENNLTSLSYLNEPEVLHNLRIRFLDRRAIYTYCGIVLVAFNPYEEVPIYDDTVIFAYSGSEDVGQALEPHVFGVAEQAFSHMCMLGHNQSIIVSGESGSGKTVNARYTLRYLATVAASAAGGLGDTHGHGQIEDRVLASNPILEAFGNAKTTRNDNSSRFGKYIQISFSAGQISHASIRTYLLEKSRVVTQAFNERNYHVFYQLCSCEDASLGLKSPDAFAYLSGGSCWTVDNLDDGEEFNVTRQAFRTLGLSDSDEWFVFTLLAAVLHLGNVSISQAETGDAACIASDDSALRLVCQLLKVDQDQLRTWLLHRRIVTVGEELIKPFTVQEASNARDALAKFVYASVFHWLVGVINKSLERRSQQPRHDSGNPFIGILDIYGFEIFQLNSFEQFCINYANEKLQQQFNIHVFKLEQQIYVAEGIDWSFVNFTDNQPCIELIERKLGVLDLLDEECKMVRGSDENWLQKMTRGLRQSGNFSLPKIGSRDCFVVKHFAESVTYTVHGFLEKNKDAVFEEQLSILKASEVDFFSRLFSQQDALKQQQQQQQQPRMMRDSGHHLPNRSLQKFNRQTVATQFKASLTELMETLSKTNPHFIRCVKPNDEKLGFSIDNRRTVEQLRACGVLETVRISAAGFPSRWTFDEFLQRYRLFAKPSKSAKVACEQVLADCIKDSEKFRVGNTRIFFRAGELAYMEKLRSDRLTWACVTIQRHYRGHRQRRRFQMAKRTLALLQAWTRGLLARRRAAETRRRRAAIVLQKTWRMRQCRRRFLRLRRAAISIQRWYRRCTARRRIREQLTQQLTVDLQRYIRGFLVRRRVSRIVRGVTLLQSHFRRRRAKRELLRLRREARDVDNLRSKNFGLENRLIELQNRLDARNAELEAAKEKDRRLQLVAEELAEAKQRQQELSDANRQLSESVQSAQQAAELSRSVAGEEAQRELERLRCGAQQEAESREARVQELEEALRAKEAENAELRSQLRGLQDELADSSQMGASHMRLVQDYDKLQNRYDNLSRQYAYVVSQRQDDGDRVEAAGRVVGDAPAGPALRQRSRTEGASEPVGLLLRLQKQLSASERERKSLQRQIERLIEHQAARQRQPQGDEYAKKLEQELRTLQGAALAGSGSKEVVMQQLESLRQELHVRREECLRLKAALGDQLVSERYGGNSELLNEDGELELAYQTLQQVNRRLKNELDDLAEQLNSKTKQAEQLESDKSRQQQLLTQMHAVFNSPALESVDSVVKFELQRMLSENLDLRAENERVESENKRLRKHSNLALNEVDHDALIPVPSVEYASDFPKLLLKLEDSGNAPYLLLCAIRWCDVNKKDSIVAQLLTETVNCWRNHCKQRSGDLSVLLLWLSNCHKMLNLLRQYGGSEGNDRYSAECSPEERDLRLRRFDLDEFSRIFHDLGVWLYQMVCTAVQQSLPAQSLILGLLEHEGIPGLPSAAKRKADPEKTRLAFEAISQRCCELARLAKAAGLADELINQLVEQTLRWLCGHCVNNLLLRRDLCHWARGMQLRYNLSQLESALRELGISAALTALEPVVQASQLLQANKQTKEDAVAIANSANLLSRGQVTKLLNLYSAQDQFEEKVSPDFIEKVNARMAEVAGRRKETEALFIDVKELQPIRLTFIHDSMPLKTVPIPSHFLDVCDSGGPGATSEA